MYGTSLIVSAHPYTFLNKVVSAYQIQPQTENNFCAEVEVSVDHVPRCISKPIKSFLEPSAAWTGRYGAPWLTGAEPQRIMQTTKKGLQKGARHYQLAVCRHDTHVQVLR
ncbi:hypothetical protein CY34DRAFT_798324 [Suillus luteus UH-Slu-Lm8-n1]|uniref:Uncharacterized protein n=1 Tax=Suillus luteus UH-Slu-Lm8-n1 TaxID=930992 RepID=A0A0D0BEK4_9AGAM|nr:hypothetical protein CY34DRAFT_798324 [Suillus luteus UH-Slu-Lm8-n1]